MNITTLEVVNQAIDPLVTVASGKPAATSLAPVSAIFNFESHDVRAFVDEHGESWFLAANACNILGYSNTSAAISKHCRAGGVTKRDTPTDSGVQEMTWINEGNLYRLIIKSRKPAAEKFERMVMEEVLPAIRKTGKFDVKTASGPLTEEMREIVKNMVIERAKTLPLAQQKSVIIKSWSALKSHFGMGYKEIPADKFVEALSLVARMQVEWEVVEPQLIPAPVGVSYHYPLAAAAPHDKYLASASLTPRTLLDPKNRAPELELLAQLEKDGHDVSGAKVRIIAMREALEYMEMTRSRMAVWQRKLVDMAEEVESHQRECGKNVLFSRVSNPVKLEVTT